MDDLERKEHLENLLEFIDRHSRYTESNFDILSSKLQEEFIRETHRLDDMKRNHYLNNLRQTRDKEEKYFERAKAKDRPREFGFFIKAFKGDVDDELMMINHSPTSNDN